MDDDDVVDDDDVDVTLIDATLALSPIERIRQNDRMLRTIELLRAGQDRARDPSPDPRREQR